MWFQILNLISTVFLFLKILGTSSKGGGGGAPTFEVAKTGDARVGTILFFTCVFWRS